MLRIEQVRKIYPDFSVDCSLEVKSGYITGIIGANGAGKSTTFKAILNLIRVDDGKIFIFGKEHTQLTNEDREAIGVVLSDTGFSRYLSIEELLPSMEQFYKNFDRKTFIQQCEKFHLPLNKKLKEFSTGMKRKFQVLAALSHDAKLLLLDEPTSGLDVTAREDVLNLLREYMVKENRAILISSHISSDLEGICDDIYAIDNGKIILHEETDVILSQYGLLKVTEEQYQQLDKNYIFRKKKEEFGYSLLTKEKQFYQENYPEIVIEKGNIDEVLLMMIRGEAA